MVTDRFAAVLGFASLVVWGFIFMIMPLQLTPDDDAYHQYISELKN